MIIGIDDNEKLVYEGSSFLGHALWPAPFLSPAHIWPEAASNLIPPRFNNLFTVPLTLFREDAFDPVSRIRRGRFYDSDVRQPVEWEVYPHPLVRETAINPAMGTARKSLFTFHSTAIKNKVHQADSHQLLVSIGSEESYLVWNVIGVEKTATGEELVTLKARQGIGAFPRLNDERIPADNRTKVVTALEKAAEDFRKAGPESIIDRCREAATAILGTYLQEKGSSKPGADLNDLVEKLEKDKKIAAANAANIIRLFHSRGKTAVQEKLDLRPLREQDAELAVHLIGTILCELGWADWAL